MEQSGLPRKEKRGHWGDTDVAGGHVQREPRSFWAQGAAAGTVGALGGIARSLGEGQGEVREEGETEASKTSTVRTLGFCGVFFEENEEPLKILE